MKIKTGLVDFSSNDYLGLARSGLLRNKIMQMTEKEAFSNGSTGSRLLTGNQLVHQEVEKHLADFFKAPAALLFNSGYTANLALMSSLPQRRDTVIYDQAIHACIKDGARISTAKCLSFRHNDCVDLKRKLAVSSGNKFVVIESLYSMEGDFPPVEQIISVCRDEGAEVIIDEAHTTGWAGENGSGWSVEKGIEGELLARVHTFGKGLGVHGACVVGSVQLVEYLINYARPFIFTTAMPAHAVVSIDCAIDVAKDARTSKESLKQNISTYLREVSGLGMHKSLNTGSPIQWLAVSGNQQAVAMSDYLQDSGFDVRPILSPTVPEGTERLRICLHAFNNEEEIIGLVRAISKGP